VFLLIFLNKLVDSPNFFDKLQKAIKNQRVKWMIMKYCAIIIKKWKRNYRLISRYSDTGGFIYAFF